MSDPNQVQQQINSVPWTNNKGLVTGAAMAALLTAIVGLFAFYAPLASPTFSGSVTLPYTGYMYGNGTAPVTASATIPASAITGLPSGVTGPVSSTSNDVATFNGTTGQVIQDGGKALPVGAVVGTTDAQTLTNKSIAATEVNSGTLAAAQMPALTGDATSGAGSVATTVGAIEGVAIASVPASGALVGTTDVQTLTNKTLTAPVIASITNTGTLTLPTSTDTLTGRATTDTLTNKSIAASEVNSGTLAAARMPALTGDATSTAGSVATTVGKIAGVTINSVPASGNLVGTSDTQTLTGKSIAATEVNSGTLAAAQMPALTGDCTTSAGAVATTCTKTNGVTLGTAATQNTVTTGSGGVPTQTVGSWTPADASGASLVFANVSAGYTQHGNMVFAYAQLTYPSTVSASAASISGLPVSFPAASYGRQCRLGFSGVTALFYLTPTVSSTTFTLLSNAGSPILNSSMSTTTLIFECIYPAS